MIPKYVPPRVSEIIAAACRVCMIDRDRILSKERSEEVLSSRLAAYFSASDHFGMSANHIAHYCGLQSGRDLAELIGRVRDGKYPNHERIISLAAIVRREAESIARRRAKDEYVTTLAYQPPRPKSDPKGLPYVRVTDAMRRLQAQCVDARTIAKRGFARLREDAD